MTLHDAELYPLVYDDIGNPEFPDYVARVYYFRVSDGLTWQKEYWPMTKSECYTAIEKLRPIIDCDPDTVYTRAEIENIFDNWRYSERYGYDRSILN